MSNKRYQRIFKEESIPKAPAYWINPFGTILPIQNEEKHIDQIIQDPEAFRLTKSQIEDAYGKHGEEMGSEGYAREDIIKDLVNKGWIRIRHYPRADFFSVNVNRMNTDTKESLYYWAKGMEEIPSYKHSEVKIDMPGKVIKSSVTKLTQEMLFDESTSKKRGLKVAKSVHELRESYSEEDAQEIKELLQSFDALLRTQLENEKGGRASQRYTGLRQQLRKFI